MCGAFCKNMKFCAGVLLRFVGKTMNRHKLCSCGGWGGCAAILTFLILTVHAAPFPLFLTFGWDDPSNGADAYVILGTNDLSAPIFIAQGGTNTVLNWPVLAVVPGTNRTATVAMIPQQLFCCCVASNFWGYSSNSNVLTFPPPGTVNNFRPVGGPH